MRLIDADALQEPVVELLDLAIKRVEDTPKDSPCYRMYVAQENERSRFIDLIDNAPTVDLTEEQAIDKLHETGWIIKHDKEMTKRTHGWWIEIDSLVNKAICSNCKGTIITEPYGKTNFCPYCGAKMWKE